MAEVKKELVSGNNEDVSGQNGNEVEILESNIETTNLYTVYESEVGILIHTYDGPKAVISHVYNLDGSFSRPTIENQPPFETAIKRKAIVGGSGEEGHPKAIIAHQFNRISSTLIKEIREKTGLAIGSNTKFYFVVQDMPYKGDAILSLRPHHLLSYEEDELINVLKGNAGQNKAKKAKVAFFHSTKEFTLNLGKAVDASRDKAGKLILNYKKVKDKNNINYERDRVKPLKEGEVGEAKLKVHHVINEGLVASPDNLHLIGLSSDTSTAFISVVEIYNDQDQLVESAVTLHWLLNDAAATYIHNLYSQNQNIDIPRFLNTIQSENPWLEQLVQLFKKFKYDKSLPAEAEQNSQSADINNNNASVATNPNSSSYYHLLKRIDTTNNGQNPANEEVIVENDSNNTAPTSSSSYNTLEANSPAPSASPQEDEIRVEPVIVNNSQTLSNEDAIQRALDGIQHYKNHYRKGFWRFFYNGASGNSRASIYQNALKSEYFSTEQKLVILVALLSTKDGYYLKNDVANCINGNQNDTQEGDIESARSIIISNIGRLYTGNNKGKISAIDNLNAHISKIISYAASSPREILDSGLSMNILPENIFESNSIENQPNNVVSQQVS